MIQEVTKLKRREEMITHKHIYIRVNIQALKVKNLSEVEEAKEPQ